MYPVTPIEVSHLSAEMLLYGLAAAASFIGFVLRAV
jgi:hypothetical protein